MGLYKQEELTMLVPAAMRVAAAYAGVVLIWGTTPLGVKWSNSTLHFTSAVGLRMALACIICMFILAYRGKPLFQSKKDWQVYFAGALTLFPTMGLVYWSAQYISSGMIAVVFGTYPFFVGLLTRTFDSGFQLNKQKMLALFFAFSGLALIQIQQVSLGPLAVYGVVAVVTATLIFAAATLWMKKIGGGVEAFRQNTGVLMFSLPGFTLLWYLHGAPAPDLLDHRSLMGVSYLVICGSVIGATLFFYVLRHCSAMTTSLIPLMTPMLAMIVGVMVDGERLSVIEIGGSIMIIVSLAIYQGAIGGIITWLGKQTGFNKYRAESELE